jgi:hypothetical protein
MRSTGYWIRQYLLATVTMFSLLIGVDLLQGTSFQDGWLSALAWAVVAAAVFIGSRYHQARKNIV